MTNLWHQLKMKHLRHTSARSLQMRREVKWTMICGVQMPGKSNRGIGNGRNKEKESWGRVTASLKQLSEDVGRTGKGCLRVARQEGGTGNVIIYVIYLFIYDIVYLFCNYFVIYCYYFFHKACQHPLFWMLWPRYVVRATCLQDLHSSIKSLPKSSGPTQGNSCIPNTIFHPHLFIYLTVC